MKESYKSLNYTQVNPTLKINDTIEDNNVNIEINTHSMCSMQESDNMEEKSGENSNANNNISYIHFNQGRWTSEEHRKFIEALFLYGNEWKRVQVYIQTRSSSQARSHAQKFFQKLKADLKIHSISGSNSESDCELIFNCLRDLLEKDNASPEENKRQMDPIFSVKAPKRVMWDRGQKERIINFLHNFNAKSRKSSECNNENKKKDKSKPLLNTKGNVTDTLTGNLSTLKKKFKIFNIEKKCRKFNCKCSILVLNNDEQQLWHKSIAYEIQKESDDPSLEMLKFLRSENFTEHREEGSNTSLESLKHKEDSNMFNSYKNPFCIQFENFVEINKEDSNINFYTDKMDDSVKFNENIFN